jgi:flagellar basal-body rod protein FlgB
VSGGILDVLQFAIDGVTASSNAVANNIANTQTPDYTDNEVSFQQSLDEAIQANGPATANLTTAPSTAAASTNGNNVDLGAELTEAEKNTLAFQTVSDSLNAQFKLSAGSAGGSYS